jgi:hypothetical protein
MAGELPPCRATTRPLAVLLGCFTAACAGGRIVVLYPVKLLFPIPLPSDRFWWCGLAGACAHLNSFPADSSFSPALASADGNVRIWRFRRRRTAQRIGWVGRSPVHPIEGRRRGALATRPRWIAETAFYGSKAPKPANDGSAAFGYALHHLLRPARRRGQIPGTRSPPGTTPCFPPAARGIRNRFDSCRSYPYANAVPLRGHRSFSTMSYTFPALYTFPASTLREIAKRFGKDILAVEENFSAARPQISWNCRRVRPVETHPDRSVQKLNAER